jgi:hypothetical protein
VGEQRAAELAERMRVTAADIESQRRADLQRFQEQQQKMVDEAREERERATTRATEAARQHQQELAAMYGKAPPHCAVTVAALFAVSTKYCTYSLDS